MSVAVLLTFRTYLVALLRAACAAYNEWMLRPIGSVANSRRAPYCSGFYSVFQESQSRIIIQFSERLVLFSVRRDRNQVQ